MGANPRTGGRRRFGSDRRASMSVEMALVTTFFLVPLLLLGIDFLFLVLGREQLAEASHATMMLAWSTPSSALDQTVLDATLAATSQGGVGTISMPAPPAESFACLEPDGSMPPRPVVAASAGFPRRWSATGSLSPFRCRSGSA